MLLVIEMNRWQHKLWFNFAQSSLFISDKDPPVNTSIRHFLLKVVMCQLNCQYVYNVHMTNFLMGWRLWKINNVNKQSKTAQLRITNIY